MALRTRLHTLALCLFLVLPNLLAAGLARADEVIRSFDAAIDLQASGAMTVTETITVNAEGNRIRRGIFRDFPLTFAGDDGFLHQVDFKIAAIERDGQAEPYHTESVRDGIRIYIGEAETFLDYGIHTYKITYETGRQIRYFNGHDELFWNVTGNGWEFSILKATARVNLPAGAEPQATVFFTGPLGAKGKNAEVTTDGGAVIFETTKPLNDHEGLTVGIKFAKGTIAPPSETDLLRWKLSDWWNAILAGGGLVVLTLFYVINWVRVGRDPDKGVIVPRWDLPAGLSPALVNYIANKGFSNGGWTAFSASALSLAVKGFITLDNIGEMVTMTRTASEPKAKLEAGEDVIFSGIKQAGASLSIAKANGKKIQTLGEQFRQAIEKDHSGKYHRFNAGIITLGIILTAAAYVLGIVYGTFNEDMLGLMVVPAVIFLFVAIFSALLSATVMSSNVAILRFFAWILLGVFWLALALVLAVSALQVFELARMPGDAVALGASMAMIVVAVAFTAIMGAATPLGRQMRDAIEGLTLYLTLAEKDRMNMAGAPAMSPQHFETLLPFAVALGVEEPWSEAFQSWLDKAGAAAAAAYQPTWYHGDFDQKHFGRQMSGFSSSLSSTLTSSLPPPPKSSSSGFSSSGGSSGGGGGGGGGGGW